MNGSDWNPLNIYDWVLKPNLSDERAGQRIARFELIELLGAGGGGGVWKAWDPNLERFVALKLPRHAHFSTRLQREARSAARFLHPNLATVLEVGEWEGQCYIASEWVDGPDLGAFAEGHSLEHDLSVDLVRQIADGLQVVHQHGAVHRDVKPGNILLAIGGDLGTPPIAKLTDFGVALLDQDEVTITREGDLVGTPAYMSPEQLKTPHEVDHRADLFSLGVVLYELVAGRRPFEGSQSWVVQQIVEKEPSRPRDRVPGLSRDLEAIILQCLEKDPDRRYQSARALALDLAQWQNGLPVLACPLGQMTRARRWLARNPVLAGAGAAVLVSMMAGSAVSLWQWRQAEEERANAVARFDQAQSLVEEVLAHLNDPEVQEIPGIQKLIRDLHATSATTLESMDPERNTVEWRRFIARVYHRIGESHMPLGSYQDAIDYHTRADRLYEGLWKAAPNDPALFDSMVKNRRSLGDALLHADRPDEATRLFESLDQWFADHQDRYPQLVNPVNRAILWNHIGLAYLQQGMVEEGVTWLENATDTWQQSGGDVHSYSVVWSLCLGNLLQAYHTLGRIDDGMNIIEQVEPDLDVWNAELSTQEGREHVAVISLNSSLILFSAGEMRRAEQYAKRAIDEFTQLQQVNPDVLLYRDYLSRLHGQLAQIQYQAGNHRKAFVSIERAIDLIEAIDKDVRTLALKRGLALRYLNRGVMEVADGRHMAGRRSYAAAFQTLQSALTQHPQHPALTQLRNQLLANDHRLVKAMRVDNPTLAVPALAEMAKVDELK